MNETTAGDPISTSESTTTTPGVAIDPRWDAASAEFASVAPIIQGGFLGVGAVLALGMILVLGPGFAPIALAFLLLLGLVGWLLARVVRVGAAALDVWAHRVAESAATERLVTKTLGRVAEALEQSPAVAVASPTAVAPASDPSAEIRRAIEEARWEEAGALIRTYHEAHPDSPAAARFEQEYEAARVEAVRELHTKIAAAREVNDADRVLELRETIRFHLDADGRHALDLELTRWLMSLIQKRLRSGSIQADVVELAAKVAERFDHTSEGASLRAALPTLRRSVGLCPRCGKPYTGLADACPKCLAPPPDSTPTPTFNSELDPEPGEGEDEGGREQIFLTDQPV